MKTIRQIFRSTSHIACLAAFISTVHSRAADVAGQAKVKVVAIMVVAPDGGKDNRSYCWKPGVTVSAKLTPEAGKIIKVDDSNSKLDSFTDDKGTDLMAAPPSDDPFNKPGLSVQRSSSKEGEASVIMDLRASGQPAAGTTGFNISGKLVATVASQSKQFTSENVAIKPGTQFNLGDMAITVSKAALHQDQFSKKDEYSVTFSSAQDLEKISRLEFFDAQGNKIEAQKRSWGGGFLGYMAEYVFKKQVDDAKIVATCWLDLKTMEMPFSIKAGAGL